MRELQVHLVFGPDEHHHVGTLVEDRHDVWFEFDSDFLCADEIEQLVVRTRNGGAEVVALLKTGSAYYAPSASAARMAKAVAENSGAVMPVCAWEYGTHVDDQWSLDELLGQVHANRS